MNRSLNFKKGDMQGSIMGLIKGGYKEFTL